jgi:hypothetical protein
MKKKLIEVALPLDAINKASAREKSIRHGHPSTLHLWWARRPLAAARAVIFAQMVDDPSAHPDLFPTEKKQEKERLRLFKIIEDLVLWSRRSATAWRCSPGNRTRSPTQRATTRALAAIQGFAAGKSCRSRQTARACWSSRTWRGDRWTPRHPWPGPEPRQVPRWVGRHRRAGCDAFRSRPVGRYGQT